MSRKKPKKPRKKSAAKKIPGHSLESLESRSSVAVTVGWLLCACATVGAIILMVAARLIYVQSPESMTLVIANVFTLISVLTGILTMILTVVVVRLRRTPPPAAITWTVLLIGLAPFVSLAILVYLER